MSKTFGKSDLLDALKKADQKHKDIKIPFSYRSLIRLEQKGIINTSNSPLEFSSGVKWRLYTREEIDDIVNKIISYKRKCKDQND